MIEMRSDTFTLPTPKMLAAMSVARLGNDDYREDPTVLELEELAASRCGTEASCLMPSGTMANLACINAYCLNGRKTVLMGSESDIYVYEADGAKACPGAAYLGLPNQADGTIALSDVEQVLDEEQSNVAVICLENPHNLRGGVVLPLKYMKELARLAHSYGCAVHLDGARIFNAAVASKTAVRTIAQYADSVQFCLSKGLAAPVGSLVAGRSEFVKKVREIRKWLGGTMRQAGVIAAPGVVALEEMTTRLAEDHANARRLAEGLARIPGIQIDLSTVQTNTVVFSIEAEHFDCEQFIQNARQHGINLSEFKYGRIRAVVHYGIAEKDIDEAVNRLADIMATEPLADAELGTKTRS